MLIMTGMHENYSLRAENIANITTVNVIAEKSTKMRNILSGRDRKMRDCPFEMGKVDDYALTIASAHVLVRLLHMPATYYYTQHIYRSIQQSYTEPHRPAGLMIHFARKIL